MDGLLPLIAFGSFNQVYQAIGKDLSHVHRRLFDKFRVNPFFPLQKPRIGYEYGCDGKNEAKC